MVNDASARNSPPVALRIVRPYPDEASLINAEAGAFSRTSVALISAPNRPSGVVLRFELVLQDGTPAMRGEGRVVGFHPAEPGREAALMLRFTRLDVRSKAFLDRVIAFQSGPPPAEPHAAPDSAPEPPLSAVVTSSVAPEAQEAQEAQEVQEVDEADIQLVDSTSSPQPPPFEPEAPEAHEDPEPTIIAAPVALISARSERPRPPSMAPSASDKPAPAPSPRSPEKAPISHPSPGHAPPPSPSPETPSTPRKAPEPHPHPKSPEHIPPPTSPRDQLGQLGQLDHLEHREAALHRLRERAKRLIELGHLAPINTRSSAPNAMPFPASPPHELATADAPALESFVESTSKPLS